MGESASLCKDRAVAVRHGSGTNLLLQVLPAWAEPMNPTLGPTRGDVVPNARVVRVDGETGHNAAPLANVDGYPIFRKLSLIVRSRR